MSRARRAAAAAVAAGLFGGTALTAASVAAPTAGASTAPAVGFAVPTVVDQYRPGYEPDNALVPQIKGDPYSGSTFVSVPNGFSTTESWIWRSDDNRRTFHLTEGNEHGKPTTCVGGGDTEMQVDPVNGHVYFADLQGLTNFSTSASADGGHTWQTTCAGVPGTAVDRQWEAIDTNGGKSAVGPGAGDGRIYLDYDNVNQDPTGGGNQLVMNASVDGVQFGNDCQGTSAGGTTVSDCPVPPAMISPNESIPGNVLVDNVAGSAYQHRVYAIHTGDGGTSVVESWCSGKPGDATAAQVAQDCTDPTAFTPGQNPNDPADRTNEYWHDVFIQPPGSYTTGQLFPSQAIDSKGNLYAVWSQYPSSGGTFSGAGRILMAVSTDGGRTWSRPVQVSQPGVNETVMPWVVAGDAGRVGVAYYAASDAVDGNVGPDGSNHASWNLFYAFSPNALAPSPAFSVNQVNEIGHPLKYGNISTGGLGGAEDRSLGDFFQVHAGSQGQAVISYVDETSADRAVDSSGGTGETPPEASGPVMVATQDSGAGLLAGSVVPNAPADRSGSVSVSGAQAARNAYLATLGQDIPAAANQQLTGAHVSSDGTNLTVTLDTADPNLASDLAVSPTLGGPVADWIVRWAAPAYKAQQQPGGYGACPATGNSCDGNIFYVAMESVGGQAPSFFTGTTHSLSTTRQKYITYPAENTADVKGSISKGTITWTVPLKDVGSPANGQGLYSITGFTVTQQQPSPTTEVTLPTGGQAPDANIPETIASTPAFDYLVGAPAGGNVPEAPYALLLLALPLGGLALYVVRRRQPRPGTARA